MKIEVKIKDVEFLISDNGDKTIPYSTTEIKSILTHIIEEYNKIQIK